MTKKEAIAHCEAWQKRLGLGHYLIEYGFGDTESDYARCHRAANYDRAVVVLAEWLFEKKPTPPKGFLPATVTDELIESFIVHELLHIVLKDYQNIIDNDLDGFLHRDVHSQVMNAMARTHENTIDRLALALVKAWNGKESS